MFKIYAFFHDSDTFLIITFELSSATDKAVATDKANIDRFKSHFNSNEPSQLQVFIFKLKRFNKYKRAVHVYLWYAGTIIIQILRN